MPSLYIMKFCSKRWFYNCKLTIPFYIFIDFCARYFLGEVELVNMLENITNYNYTSHSSSKPERQKRQ